jgi:hypothetical protein
VWVSGFTANATAFLGNEFVINSLIKSEGFAGKNCLLELLEDGRKIQSKTLNLGQHAYFESIDWIVKPTTAGLRKYQIRIVGPSSEINLKNNTEHLWVEVTNTKRKIHLSYHAPNPDIGAISRALEDFGHYELQKSQADKTTFSNQVDLYILHGYAANPAQQAFVKQLIQAKMPFWLILSTQSTSRFTNFSEYGISPGFDQTVMTEAQAVFNTGFDDFVIDELGNDLKSWPPLKVPNGRYPMPPMFRTLLWQKLGAIETTYPLMGFTTIDGKRQGWLFGEGFWKWRLQNFQRNGNTQAFDQWILKTVQYLSTGEIKNKFRVYAEKNTFGAGDHVRVYAEYLDKTGNLVNKADCKLVVSSKETKKVVNMTRTGNRYVADLGGMSADDYNLSAQLSSPATTAVGRFEVSSVEDELKNLKADHGLLKILSTRNHAQFYQSSKVKELINQLLSGKYNTTVLSEVNKVTELIQLKWVFALLILLFGAEWFLRKREGSY